MRDTIEVTLKISAEGAYRVYDEFAEKMITYGSYNVAAEFPEGNWLNSYLQEIRDPSRRGWPGAFT
jgi:hypothetical protein